MKPLLWVFILMPFISVAQVSRLEINSFIGIEFGASKDEVLQTSKKLAASVSGISEQEDLIYLTNLKVAGFPCRQTYFRFIDDKFFKGIMEIDVDEVNFLHVYNQLKLQISSIYGYGKDFSRFETPYYFGDGYEFNSIIYGKGKICHAWGNVKQITADNFISIEICSDRVLRVVFQNQAYAALASNKHQQLTAK